MTPRTQKQPGKGLGTAPFASETAADAKGSWNLVLILER